MQRKSPRLAVLFADDTPAYERIVRQVLRQRGHQVTFAQDGREALELFLEGDFDVVIVDVQMPRMNGIELTRAIRQRERPNRRVPIVGLTAQASPSHSEHCTAAGMDVCLPKPLEAETLLDTIERLTINNPGAAIASSTSNETTKTETTKTETTKTGAMKTEAMMSGVTAETSGQTHASQNSIGRADDIVDFQGAMTRLANDLELFKEFVKVYDEDVPGLMAALRSGVQDRTAAAVERNAHSLRGLISNFGAKIAVEAASHVEEIGKKSQWDEVDAAMSYLDKQMDRLTAALNPYRS